MKTININGKEVTLEVGSVIEFINLRNYKVVIKVTRVEEKSFYTSGRHSYGTLKDWAKCEGFKIYK